MDTHKRRPPTGAIGGRSPELGLSRRQQLIPVLGDGGRTSEFGSMMLTNHGLFEATPCPWKSRSSICGQEATLAGQPPYAAIRCVHAALRRSAPRCRPPADEKHGDDEEHPRRRALQRQPRAASRVARRLASFGRGFCQALPRRDEKREPRQGFRIGPRLRSCRAPGVRRVAFTASSDRCTNRREEAILADRIGDAAGDEDPVDRRLRPRHDEPDTVSRQGNGELA
jgi:hypothetical protein